MQAFKLNLRIIWKRLPLLSIYLITFITISITVANATASDPATDSLFETVKIDAAFFSDETTAITSGLYEELEKTVNFHVYEDDQEVLADALYWGDLDYIIRIPAGFTASILEGDAMAVERSVQPASAAAVYTDMAVEKYIASSQLYARFALDLTAEGLAEYLREDLARTSPVRLLDEKNEAPVYGLYFFNYMSYALLAVLILGMGTLMLSFKNPELKRRNTASPQSSRSQVLGFIFANLCFGLITWLCFVIANLILDRANAASVQTRWFIINSLVFTIAASALSFMIGALIKKPSAIDAVSNVVSLGTAFISGTFVPQEFLAASVLNLAKLTPVYWYILANNRIASISEFNQESLMRVWQPMAIVIAFALLFILISFAGMKRQRYAYK